MFSRNIFFLVFMFNLTWVLLLGCSNSTASPSATVSTKQSASPPVTNIPGLKPYSIMPHRLWAEKKYLLTTIEGHEKIRAALADDQAQAAVIEARALITLLSTHQKDLPPAILESLQKLSSGSTQSIAEIRMLYGEWQKQLVLHLQQEKELRALFTLFECPMAKGYRRWIQPINTTMANPYMGKNMLECGFEVKWDNENKP